MRDKNIKCQEMSLLGINCISTRKRQRNMCKQQTENINFISLDFFSSCKEVLYTTQMNKKVKSTTSIDSVLCRCAWTFVLISVFFKSRKCFLEGVFLVANASTWQRARRQMYLLPLKNIAVDWLYSWGMNQALHHVLSLSHSTEARDIWLLMLITSFVSES